MEKGDLVKAKQGTVEGDSESLGIGVIVEAKISDGWGNVRHKVAWVTTSLKPWLMYEEDLERINNPQRNTEDG